MRSPSTIIKYLSLIVCGLAMPLLASNNYQIQQADKYFASRDTSGHLQKSIDLAKLAYKQASSMNERYTALWVEARAYTEAVEYAPWSKKDILKGLKRAQKLTSDAKNIDSEQTHAHYWYAVALGREAELKGVMSSLKSVKPIRRSMEIILDNDPTFHRALYVLSRLYRKAPKVISIGDPEKSLKYINEALKLDPTDSRYLLEKAEVLIKLDQKKEARKILTQLESLEYQPKYFLSTFNKDKYRGLLLQKSL